MVLPREMFARGAVEVAPALLGCVLEHETPDGLVAVVLTEVEAYHGQADPASHAYRGRTARNAVMFGPPGHAYVYFTYGMHFCVNLVCLPEGTASAVLLRAGRVIAGIGLAAARRAAGRDLAADDPAEGGPRGGDLAGRPGTGRRGTGSQAACRQPAERDLARGPARLCKALGITRALDGTDVCDPASPLRVRWRSSQDGGETVAAGRPGRDGAAGPGLLAEPQGRQPPYGPAEVAGSAGAGEVAGPGNLKRAGNLERASGLAEMDISQGPRVGISAATELPWRFWLAGDPTVSAYRPHTPRRARAK